MFFPEYCRRVHWWEFFFFLKTCISVLASTLKKRGQKKNTLLLLVEKCTISTFQKTIWPHVAFLEVLPMTQRAKETPAFRPVVFSYLVVDRNNFFGAAQINCVPSYMMQKVCLFCKNYKRLYKRRLRPWLHFYVNSCK